MKIPDDLETAERRRTNLPRIIPLRENAERVPIAIELRLDAGIGMKENNIKKPGLPPKAADELLLLENLWVRR